MYRTSQAFAVTVSVFSCLPVHLSDANFSNANFSNANFSNPHPPSFNPAREAGASGDLIANDVAVIYKIEFENYFQYPIHQVFSRSMKMIPKVLNMNIGLIGIIQFNNFNSIEQNEFVRFQYISCCANFRRVLINK